jgi:hypothetical protein
MEKPIERWFKFLPNNEWTHVVITNKELFIDGKLVGVSDDK